MTRYDPSDVANRIDIDRLEGRIERVEEGLRQFSAEISTDLKSGLAAVNARLDNGLTGVNLRLNRLLYALIAGLFVVVAAMLGVLATTL